MSHANSVSLVKLRRVLGKVRRRLRARSERRTATQEAQLSSLNLIQHLLVGQSWATQPTRMQNPLTAEPRKYWSQTDEDGILEKILHRIGYSQPGTFLEFGVGDGRENNTLLLLALGWRGGWVGGQELVFQPKQTGRLRFIKDWITLDNIGAHANELMNHFGITQPDVVSLDLDGNDLHFTQYLLEIGLRPAVWISEYNAKFPYGVRWTVTYDSAHTWNADDYWGASFSSFCDLFATHDYFPVACSVQGANVFFIRGDLRDRFADIPKNPAEIYQPPLHYLVPRWGHRASPKTLQSLTD